MSKFKAGDKILYYGKKYKIDYIREDGTAKIHSACGKINEICFHANVSRFEKYNRKNSLSEK